MKQIRFQPLSHTYQTLSMLLCNTALHIQTTDYTITAEWMRLIQEVKKTFTIFKNYAEQEENILFPLLHHFEPALVALLRDDQCNRLRYLNELSGLFCTMQAATDKEKCKLFSHKLLYRLNEFVAAALQQLNEHETMINAVLWRYCSDKELVQLAAAFVPAIASHKKDTSFADNIINSMIPVTAVPSIHKHNSTRKVFKQHRASKELAIAI